MQPTPSAFTLQPTPSYFIQPTQAPTGFVWTSIDTYAALAVVAAILIAIVIYVVATHEHVKPPKNASQRQEVPASTADETTPLNTKDKRNDML